MKINAIILDWAGTTVDYGCFAPVNAFINAFGAFGIKANVEETRAPMGLQKRRHIEKMLEQPGLASQWLKVNGRAHTQDDINRIYARFEPALFEVLTGHADPLPGVIETIAHIRKMDIAIGSTTGYTQAMMNVLVPLAKKKGYAPDCIVCPDDTSEGRPHPYMLWRNLEKLGMQSIHGILKVGDTVADMQEGKNAGCLCVGVLKGSSMLGLNEQEFAQKSSAEVLKLFAICKQKYMEAGADFVIEDFSALPALIESLNNEGA
ncbi:MAG: phosphonoacetaldehyde hydrolase [Fibromonadaceae bacterium]|jgi:phosphonoacetaldehyde hydrolase|nr:phosphonoacetaldehyde hydrolase [Fibromonadaceae bacterium]